MLFARKFNITKKDSRHNIPSTPSLCPYRRFVGLVGREGITVETIACIYLSQVPPTNRFFTNLDRMLLKTENKNTYTHKDAEKSLTNIIFNHQIV